MATKNLQQPNIHQSQTNGKQMLQSSPGHLLKSAGQSTLNQRYNSNNSSGVYQSGLPQIYYNKQTQRDLTSKSTNNLKQLRTEGNKSESLEKSNLAKSLCIISQEELNRIKQRIKIQDDAPTYDRYAEKKKLHELSMKRIENWPDNLLNITQKKERERFEKFEKIEKEKRIIDEQEEAYKREQYRKIIKDSNEKIFAQDPRVRQFKKSMLFSDVVQERKEQMELKKYVDDIHKNYNNEQSQQMETIKLQEEEDKQKLKEKKLAQLQQMKQDLARQLQEMKDKKIQQILDDQKEGALIKERAKEENQENIEKKRKQRAMNLDLQKQLDENQKKKEIYMEEVRQKEQEEDSKMQEYIQNKSQLVEMRKLREEQKIKEKIEIRQRLYDFQVSQLKQKKDNEEQRIQSQVQQLQEKEEKQKQEKESDLKKRREEIKQSIKESIEIKKKLEEDRKRKENEFAQQLLSQSKIIEQGEKEEKVFHKRRELNIRQFQQSQMDEKKQKVQQRFDKELEEDMDLRNSIEIDKRIFKSWAESAIGEWKETGKDIYPLLKQLKEIEKSS